MEQHCRSQMLQQRPAFVTTKGWRCSLGTNIHWCWRTQTVRRSKGAVEEQPDSCAGLECFASTWCTFWGEGRIKKKHNCICVWCVCVVTSKDRKTETYTTAFGYAFAATYYKMNAGIWGLRNPQDSTLSFFNFGFTWETLFKLSQWWPLLVNMERSSLEERKQDDVNSILQSMMAEPLDWWEDADLPSVLTYLRGNKSLNVPSAWRSILGMNKWVVCLHGFWCWPFWKKNSRNSLLCLWKLDGTVWTQKNSMWRKQCLCVMFRFLHQWGGVAR